MVLDKHLHITKCMLSATNGFKTLKTMKGLDTVESLSAEASGNLSKNRNHLISTND